MCVEKVRHNDTSKLLYTEKLLETVAYCCDVSNDENDVADDFCFFAVSYFRAMFCKAFYNVSVC